jgi:DNA-binding MarR family transcriptional regulator
MPTQERVKARINAVSAWESLFRAQVAVMRTLAAEFPTKDISFNEYDVLFNLSRQPDRELRMRDLNKHVLLTQPSVSRLIDRLVARGLVSKCPEPSDARGTVIRLTDDGYDMFRRVAVEHMKTITERVGGRLDAEELEQLAQLCDKLRGPD